MAGAFKFKLNLSGIRELEKQLKALGSEKTAKKVLRRAATAAIRPMRRACKAACPVDSGALKKSIDSKTTNKGLRVNAIVGSDTSVMDDGKKEHKGSEGTERAARHLHLVLFGHITEEGKAVPANNFLQKGYESSISTCQKTYEEKLKGGIEQAVEGSK